MRSVRSLFWSSLFLLGAAVPAFCQVIVPPNIPGAAVPANIGTAAVQETVFSTGPFDFSLLILRNGQLKYCASATICTVGPFKTLTFDVPFGNFGLTAGDTLIFVFQVRHRGSEGNTVSTRISFIPVVAATETTPPPETTAVPRPPPAEFARWVRREEMSNG